MPNINAVVNEQIRRLARREITINTKTVKRATVQYRHAIAALKKQLADLTKRLAFIERHQPAEAPSAEVPDKSRFRAMGVKAHRAKLGLSAKDYGKLVGVSSLTVYNWENGKSRPRNKQTAAKWLAIRSLGKREAWERLGLAQPKSAALAEAPASPQAGRRSLGKLKPTGEEMILSLLKGRNSLTSSQINEAWRKEGRLGNADNSLSLMTKAKKLKRTKLKGQRGSEYRTA